MHIPSLVAQSRTLMNIFGTIDPPPGTPPGDPENAIVTALNVGLNLTMIIAGFVTLINFIRAGYTYMMAGGDAKKLEEAQNLIKWSAAGLLVVVIAPLAGALIGYIVFGDPMAILRPKITTIP